MGKSRFPEPSSTMTWMLSLLLLCSCSEAPSFNNLRSASTADLKIGDMVCWKPNAEATIDGKKVDVNPIQFPAAIFEIQGDEVLVGKAWERLKKVQVWIHKSDVMKVNEALDYYSEQIQKDPINPLLWLSRGLIREHHVKLEDALKDFSEAIKLDPKLAEAYKQRGKTIVSWDIEGELETSFSDFSEVIRLAPNDPMGYFWRGHIWRKKGDIDDAIEDYTKAIDLDPEEGRYYLFRAGEWLAKSNVNQVNAIKDFTEAIRLDPTRSTAYVGRGSAAAESGDFENADKDFSQAIRLDPKDAEDFNSIAWFHATCPEDRFRSGNKAVQYAKKACELTVWKNGPALDTLASAYAEAGEFLNAIDWQKKAIELLPETQKKEAAERLELYRSNKPYRDMPKK